MIFLSICMFMAKPFRAVVLVVERRFGCWLICRGVYPLPGVISSVHVLSQRFSNYLQFSAVISLFITYFHNFICYKISSFKAFYPVFHVLLPVYCTSPVVISRGFVLFLFSFVIRAYKFPCIISYFKVLFPV